MDGCFALLDNASFSGGTEQREALSAAS